MVSVQMDEALLNKINTAAQTSVFKRMCRNECGEGAFCIDCHRDQMTPLSVTLSQLDDGTERPPRKAATRFTQDGQHIRLRNLASFLLDSTRFSIHFCNSFTLGTITRS